MNIPKQGVNQCFIWNQEIVKNTAIPKLSLIFPGWEWKAFNPQRKMILVFYHLHLLLRAFSIMRQW